MRMSVWCVFIYHYKKKKTAIIRNINYQQIIKRNKKSQKENKYFQFNALDLIQLGKLFS